MSRETVPLPEEPSALQIQQDLDSCGLDDVVFADISDKLMHAQSPTATACSTEQLFVTVHALCSLHRRLRDEQERALQLSQLLSGARSRLAQLMSSLTADMNEHVTATAATPSDSVV